MWGTHRSAIWTESCNNLGFSTAFVKGYPSCFNQDLLLELATLDRVFFLSATFGSTDNGASGSQFRVAGHSRSWCGGGCKERAPVGRGEGDRGAPCAGVDSQATFSGRCSRATRSASGDHRLLPAQPAHQLRRP